MNVSTRAEGRRWSRRDMLRGGVAMAALALSREPLRLFGFEEPQAGEEVLPFLDVQPAGKMLRWEELTSWITPNEKIFAVSHYGQPQFDAASWRLEISGLVRRPQSLTLEQIRSRPKKEVVATLECSGNGSSPTFMGAIGNVRWTGTPLGPLLKESNLRSRAIEVVFFGADEKAEKIRGNDYVQNFARSLSLADAMRGEVLLAYEMNGEPLPKEHGGPVRLVVPGWFGIAWVKWLTRIELLDRRYMSRFMARDYVTIRGEEKEGRTIWRETSVGPIDVKSILARAVRMKNGDVRLSGAAWTDGTPLKSVEVKMDQGDWQGVVLEKKPHDRYGWTLWHYDWKKPSAGEHVLISRATDEEGRIQPSAEDPMIKNKRTYWEANQQYPRRLKV